MKDKIRFDEPGSLAKPGPIGRSVRLVLGTLLLWLVWQLTTRASTPDWNDLTLWLLVWLGLVLVPYVVNIGFGVNWGAWPRILSAAMLLGVAAVSYMTATSPGVSPLLWATANIWMIYIFAHLGASFLLAALLATPGCEMRAMPHLLGLLFKYEVREHYCPGFIHSIDRWEHGLHTKSDDSGKVE